jgi:hypothetical protein
MFERFETPVRCKDGHLFTTIWVPFGSLKALRLGNRRYQHCPVGHHWSTVMKLNSATAAGADLAQAAEVHDSRVP